MSGRCTKGFYDIMGIDDTIATDKTDYIRIAVRLATDDPFRRGVERQIAAASKMLWDRPSTVAEWEQFLQEAASGSPISNTHAGHDGAAVNWKPTRSKPKPSASRARARIDL